MACPGLHSNSHSHHELVWLAVSLKIPIPSLTKVVALRFASALIFKAVPPRPCSTAQSHSFSSLLTHMLIQAPASHHPTACLVPLRQLSTNSTKSVVMHWRQIIPVHPSLPPPHSTLLSPCMFCKLRGKGHHPPAPLPVTHERQAY